MSDIYVHRSVSLRKAEQNEVARKFVTGLGGGFGFSKTYRCDLCGEVVTAPSPRLAARYHSDKHPEIEDAFTRAGLYDLWMED